MAQLFTNLFDNIVIHAQGAHQASIYAATKAGWVVLCISDDGRGIPSEARGRVLERFVKLDDARNRPGYGLGLPLVCAIVAIHEGRFAFMDGDDAGLTGQIKLHTAD